MSDFRAINVPELDRLREWFTVHPGDDAKQDQAQLPSPDATPTCPLLCSTHKCREGVEL